jgi:hypothetical protein
VTLNDSNDKATDAIIDLLKRDDLHEPPPWLDAQLREMILEDANASLIRPFVAFGLTSAAFFAVLVGIASVLADTAIAEWGPGIAVGIGLGYLAISAAAALPLVIEHRQSFNERKVEA